MCAIISIRYLKQGLFLLIPLLFLFSGLNLLYSQDKKINSSKPSGINSWKPSFMLPKAEYYPGMDSPGPDSVKRTDFTVTMRDGIIIDCLKYIPVRSVVPAGGYLTVIMVHGYGDSKNTLATFCHDQATYGYYCMTFSVRGQGLSGGLSNLISDVEALDLLEIITAVKRDSVNGSNPGKILIMGGSQGGLLPMKAACMGGQPVTTLISALAPPNFASSWIENGSIKMTALWTMDYNTDTARYSQGVINMRNWILANNKAGWDSLSRNMPIGRDFVNSLTNCNIPVYVEGSWQDKFFNASGWLDNFTKLHVPYTSYFGAVQGHGGDHSATEDVWHMNWFNNWFLQWLWNSNTNILSSAKYQDAYTTFPAVGSAWTFVHDSLKTPMVTTAHNLRLFFCPQNELRPVASTKGKTETLLNDIDPSYTFPNLIADDFKGSRFNSKWNTDTVIFESYELTSSMKWTGAPTIGLDYSSTATGFCQFNYQIFEVLPNGQEKFINRGNFTDRNYVKNSRKTATFKGMAHAHTFQSGSIIRIRVTNFDRTAADSTFFGSAPFVLPVMNKGSHKIYESAASYIDFPILNTNNPFQGSYGMPHNGEANNNNVTPYIFSLAQNYPNPFNPNTEIRYSIPYTGNVELKIYDVAGREVSTLVNSVQNPGSYNVIFDASNLSSGVYFYKLVAGNYSDIKKMILVK